MKHGSRMLKHIRNREATEILEELIRTHPALARKVDRIAAKVLGNVSLNSIAKRVSQSLLMVDGFSSIEESSGSVPGGYIEPEQAACDLCEETTQLFLKEIQRRIKMGDVEGAWTV